VTVYFVENENPRRNSSGGIMSYLMMLSRHLQKKGVRTVLLGTGEPLPEGSRPFSDFMPVVSREVVSNARYLRALWKAVFRLKAAPPSIVHAQRPDMLVPFILRKKDFLLVCTLHGAHDLAVLDKKGAFLGWIYGRLQRLSFRQAHWLIAVDKNTRNHYLGKYPWLREKISVIPTGIDLDKFKPMDRDALRAKYDFRPQDKVILFVGRLEKEKNLPLLLEAFAILREESTDVKLVLVGKGREEAVLKRRISELKLEQVLLLGEMDNERIPELMNCADVLVLCSLYEGSPSVIKEALACNRPVVAVDVGDVRQVIEGIQGCFIADGTARSIAEKISAVWRASGTFEAREKVLKYGQDHVGEETLRVYRQLSTKARK
jgi:glycosyltransferase involved in cell wall biosynthesis